MKNLLAANVMIAPLYFVSAGSPVGDPAYDDHFTSPQLSTFSNRL